MSNEKFIGKKWGEVKGNFSAHQLNVDKECVDKKTSECIVDIASNLAVVGKLIENENETEIVIDDNAVVYESC